MKDRELILRGLEGRFVEFEPIDMFHRYVDIVKASIAELKKRGFTHKTWEAQRRSLASNRWRHPVMI